MKLNVINIFFFLFINIYNKNRLGFFDFEKLFFIMISMLMVFFEWVWFFIIKKENDVICLDMIFLNK